MIGVLIVAGIIFYGLLYSGLKDLGGEKISTLDALLGRGAASTDKAKPIKPSQTQSVPANTGGGRVTRNRSIVECVCIETR